MICFHRGDREAALRHLTAAAPHAARIGNRLVPPLVLARSLAHETAGELREALAELTPWLNGGTEESAQAEDLLADAARLAMRAGNEDLARNLAKVAGGSPPSRTSRAARRPRCTAPDSWMPTRPGSLRQPTSTRQPEGHYRGREHWKEQRRNCPEQVTGTSPKRLSPAPGRSTPG